MANVLGELFGDIASTIREKTGDTATMKPAEFPEKIGKLADSSKVTAIAEDVLEGKSIVDADGNEIAGSMPNNGARNPRLDPINNEFNIPIGYHDGNGVVTVYALSKPATPSKTKQVITGYEHFPPFYLTSVTVDPIPDEYQDVSGVTATAEDVREGKVFVDAQGNEVTGTISGSFHDVSEVTATAEDVLEGKVIVDAVGNKVTGALVVKGTGSGGSSLPAGAYWKQASKNVPFSYARPDFFKYQDKLYVFVKNASSGDTYNLYEYFNEEYTLVKSDLFVWFMTNPTLYKGNIHFLGMNAVHYMYDGTTVTELNKLPGEVSTRGNCFIWNDVLYAFVGSDGLLYQWDETTDTWLDSGITNAGLYTSGYVFVHNNELYRYNSNILYKYVNGDAVQVATFAHGTINIYLYTNGYLYTCNYNGSCIYKYDIDNAVETAIGFIPALTGNGYLYEYNGEIRAAGGSSAPKTHLTLYEVTE